MIDNFHRDYLSTTPYKILKISYVPFCQPFIHYIHSKCCFNSYRGRLLCAFGENACKHNNTRMLIYYGYLLFRSRLKSHAPTRSRLMPKKLPIYSPTIKFHAQ